METPESTAVRTAVLLHMVGGCVGESVAAVGIAIVLLYSCTWVFQSAGAAGHHY